MTAKLQETVAEEATTGVLKLKELVPKDKMLFRHQYERLPNDVMRVSNATIGGKYLLACGYSDVDNGLRFRFQ